MKKKIISLSFFVILTISLNSVQPKDGFRGLQWGASKEDIIKKEGNPIAVHENKLVYADVIGDMKAAVFYEIVDNKMVSGFYVFDINNINDKLYVDDFESLKDVLIKKYGIPFSDDIYWYDDSFKDYTNMLSFAIKQGHVEYKTIWELDKTRIKLSLAGVDGTIFISISYISKDYLDFLSEDLDENL